MTRNEFEQAAKAQNERRATEVAQARETGAACVTTPMMAFGGVDWCSTHRTMGPCPFAPKGGVK